MTTLTMATRLITQNIIERVREIHSVVCPSALCGVCISTRVCSVTQHGYRRGACHLPVANPIHPCAYQTKPCPFRHTTRRTGLQVSALVRGSHSRMACVTMRVSLPFVMSILCSSPPLPQFLQAARILHRVFYAKLCPLLGCTTSIDRRCTGERRSRHDASKCIPARSTYFTGLLCLAQSSTPVVRLVVRSSVSSVPGLSSMGVSSVPRVPFRLPLGSSWVLGHSIPVRKR